MSPGTRTDPDDPHIPAGNLDGLRRFSAGAHDPESALSVAGTAFRGGVER